MNIKDLQNVSLGLGSSRNKPRPTGRPSLAMVGLGVACVIGMFALLALLYALN